MTEYITVWVDGLPDLTPGEEITRCRDCKHYDTNDAASEVYPDRYWCNKLCHYMQSCEFCSRGERKCD